MVSTWVGDHHGIPCAVRPFSLFQHGWQPRAWPRRGSDPRDLERTKQKHKALGLCLAQRPGAFFFLASLICANIIDRQEHHHRDRNIIIGHKNSLLSVALWDEEEYLEQTFHFLLHVFSDVAHFIFRNYSAE